MPSLLVWSKEVRNPAVYVEFFNFCKFSINFKDCQTQLRGSLCYFCKHMVVTGKVGGSEGREVGVSLASWDWRMGLLTGRMVGTQLILGRGQDAEPQLPCITPVAQALALAWCASPSWQLHLWREWWGQGVEGLPLPHFLAKQYWIIKVVQGKICSHLKSIK